MLMLCWFYCIPFAKFLYFSLAPIMFVFALFMLRRGIRANRAGLRQAAFIVMFVSLLKLCLPDILMLKDEFLCGFNAALTEKACNRAGVMMLQAAGIVLMVVGSVLLFHFYRVYMNVRKLPPVKPEDIHLGFWANLTLVSVFMMVIWQLAPWVGTLLTGATPAIFVNIPWQALAVLNLALLLWGFWKAEACVWDYDVTQKSKMAYLNKTWTAKDTLWMSVFIYLVTLALSYVAHDVLAVGKVPTSLRG